ncbi:DUF916 domain-containing protein [Levilactobacillus zymae]|nr:DUF916 domain-containing protein [Levilactobacillus zymae]QFR60710.1 DUF916 domain-containing protein [Levilactobacillus zymae]
MMKKGLMRLTFRQHLIRWGLVGSLLILGLFGGTCAHAATPANGAFSVAPILPRDNQSGVAYFKFATKPGQTRDLRLRVTNQTHAPAAYDVTPRLASTNTNGYLDYGHNNTNAALPAQARDLFQPSHRQVVQIPAQTSRVVHVKFTGPKKSFAGIMLGGITVAHHADHQPAATKGTGIVATTEYVVAAEFYQHRAATPLTPAVTFKSAQYRLAQAHPQLTLQVVNHTADLVAQGHLKAKLTNLAGKTVAKFDQAQLMFAPQDAFSLNLPVTAQHLTAGKYTLTGMLTTPGDFNFPINLPLTVSPQRARAVDQHAANFKKRAPVNWGLVAILGLLGMILVSLLGVMTLLLRGHRLSRVVTKPIERRNLHD